MSENPEKQLQRLANIETKVQALQLAYREAQQRLSTARQEIERLRTVIQGQEEEIKNFRNQDNITKIVRTIAVDTTNATELKLRINEYIREIDKCIAYLKD